MIDREAEVVKLILFLTLIIGLILTIMFGPIDLAGFAGIVLGVIFFSLAALCFTDDSVAKDVATMFKSILPEKKQKGGPLDD